MSSSDPLSPVPPAEHPILPASDKEAASPSTTVHSGLENNKEKSALVGIYDEIFRSLAHGDGSEAAFALIAEKIRLLTDCSSAAIALLNSDSETLTFAAAAGQEAQDLIGSRVHLTDTVLGKTAHTGEPYLAFRPQAMVYDSKVPQEVASAAVTAIFNEGRSVGAVAALNKAGGHPFSGDDIMALSTMAAAAAVVLRNTRLQSDALRQGRELSTLYDAVRSVSGQLSAQEVLQTVVEQAGAHMGNSAVVVFLANDERTHLYIAADIGLDAHPEQREIMLSADSGIGAAALAKIMPLEIAFSGIDDQSDPQSAFSAAGGSANAGGIALFESPFPDLNVRSGLSAGIRSGDVIHGFVLVLSGEPPGLYTRADANLLSALASQAAVAMGNAWLYEDATRRASEATTLYDLSQAVTSTLRLPQVLDRIADSVLKLLDVDKFALFLHDPAKQRLQMVVERGLPTGASERVQPGLGQGIPGWVMEFETPTAVQDVAADHRNASAPLHTEGVVSMTCMPLQSGIDTIGVLCALTSRRRLFTVAEMELLYTIANQAAIAIGNARVYEDVQQKSRELRKYFHRVSRALGSSQSPRAVPETIVALTQEITNCDYCALYSALPAASQIVGMTSVTPRRLVTEAQVGFKILTGFPPPEGETPAQWVARRGRALAIADIESDSRFRDTALRPQRGRFVSYLGVPLRGAGGRQDVVGVLEIYTRDRREWRSEEVRLLITFASQAAAALRSAHEAEQYGKSQRRNDVLLSMLKITNTAQEERSAQQVLDCLSGLFDDSVPMIAFRRDPAISDIWRCIAARNSDARLLQQIGEDLHENGAPDRVTSKDKTAYIYMEESGLHTLSEADFQVCQTVADEIATGMWKDSSNL
ncbi:MAG: GAF domain-containing protein [Armatimonadota bacterium]